MLIAPRFWSDTRARAVPRLLAPIERVVTAVAVRRACRPRWHASVPVLCCGNATVGGAGKTTLAIDMVERLRDRGRNVHCLTRGYGGQVRGVVKVDPALHTAAMVGDEALLLAAHAPTWVSADRSAGARAAVAAGADCLVLDDGFQNTTLFQDLPVLVVDGAAGFGNGHVLPAGPLREPLRQAFDRARAVVII
ncbi:tetraacyldisaccharide 4'-kinase, partial [Ameyamaea chiangmaiensis]